jgi:(R)-2-hydroxyacyl-CoA dehydratese activating ATPase
MDTPTDRVVMTGGVVAHNPYIVEMAEEMIGRPVVLPEQPQLAGAIGAALYALDRKGDENG